MEELSGKACTVLRAMAMLGQGAIGEAIVNGILQAYVADGGGSVEGMIRNVVVKELMHGSSLISCDEGDGKERRVYRMHRLVRRFILSGMIRGSALWNHVYSLALPAVHACVRIELEEEGNSFSKLPDVFEKNHREFTTHCLALAHHHTLSMQGSEMQHVSEVKDILLYSGRMMNFMGKWEEEIQVWKHLLVILQHQQEENRRSCIKHFLNVSSRRNRRKETKIRIAWVYDSLGVAVMQAGKLISATSKLEKSIAMRQAIHGHNKPHPEIAGSLNNLGLVHHRIGELEKALEKHEESLAMRRAIHGLNKPHLYTAMSLWSIGFVYHMQKNQIEAAKFLKESLAMLHILQFRNPHDPQIMSVLSTLTEVIENQVHSPK